eukprot:365928-Chlamydomonas_euryale.AAC.6
MHVWRTKGPWLHVSNVSVFMRSMQACACMHVAAAATTCPCAAPWRIEGAGKAGALSGWSSGLPACRPVCVPA